jgi:hypothetical protein
MVHGSHRHHHHHHHHFNGLHVKKSRKGEEAEDAVEGRQEAPLAPTSPEQNVEAPPSEQQQQQQLAEQPAVQQQSPDNEDGEQRHSGGENRSLERAMSPIYESLRQPVYSYIRPRGIYIGLQINGAVITERAEANAAFYGAPVTAHQILEGQLPGDQAFGPDGGWMCAVTPLTDAMRWAEGQRT